MANLRFSAPDSEFEDDAALVSANLLPITPSYTLDLDTTERMNEIKFGDGYSQRSLDGINTDALEFTAVFANRSELVITAIYDFLKGVSPYNRNMTEYFYFLVPAPINEEMKFIVKDGKIKVTNSQANSFTLTATFVRVFDLE